MLEEGHSYRVVCWEIGWLVRGKVSKQDPMPRGDQNILTFDVPMADTLLMTLCHSVEKLKSDPVLQECN